MYYLFIIDQTIYKSLFLLKNLTDTYKNIAGLNNI